MNKKDLKLGFIGCGKMASAIIEGVLSSGFLSKDQIFASEVTAEIAQKKSVDLGITVFTDNCSVASDSDVVFIATKPAYVREVLVQIAPCLKKHALIVSIAAGVKTETIENALNSQNPVIRVMPNGPAVIMQGMSGISKGKFATDEHVDFVFKLFSQIGKAVVVDEDKIDVVTAISGSGPAFFYKIIHEMALAGEKLGLEYDKAILLAAQTAIGSAKLMITSDLSPQDLIKNIATKGGCTEVGVDYMNSSDTEKLFQELIFSTTEKAKALGN